MTRYGLGLTLELSHLLANQTFSIHRRQRLESAASGMEPNPLIEAELLADASYCWFVNHLNGVG